MALSRTQLRAALTHMQAGDWQAAHEIVQRDEESSLSCWAHGTVHLMEGDVPNARYWYREAKRPFPKKASAEAELEALHSALSG